MAKFPTSAEAQRIANRVAALMLPDEGYRYWLCISFWEVRKVRGILSIFFIAHNLHCSFRADHYRALLHKNVRK